MNEGRIPLPEALHYAMSLAESLRKLHDAGKAHGAVAPSGVVLTATGLELIPSLGPPATITPYTAPEVLQGQPADARSDIFSFGAIIFEMLTGRPAFDGEGQTELTLALCNSAPPPSGSPAVDRLVAGCVAKSPAARWQRMQKIIMELKLLTVAARRADAAPAARGVSDAALRSEIQQLEDRLAARLASHEKTVAEKQHTAGQAVEALHQQLAGIHSQLAAVQERPTQPALDLDALTRQLAAQVKEAVEAANQQHTAQLQDAIAAVTQQLTAHVKEAVEAAKEQHAAELEDALGAVARQTAAANEQQTAQLQDAVGAVSQQLTAHVKETVEAANEQRTAQLQDAVGAVTQQLTAHVKEAVEAAHQQHTAQLQDAVGAVSQQLTAHVKEAVEAANQQLTAQVQETIAAANQQHNSEVRETIAAAAQQQAAQVNETVAALNQRTAAAEQNMEEIRKHFSTLQSNVAADLHDFEHSLKTQSVAIESARTAMAQTDDLVERVVEALELLQTSVLDQHEAAVN